MPRGITPAAYPRVQTSRASSPLLFGLAPRGVFRAPDVAIGAVGSYPTFSPLPESAREAKTSRRFTCAISPCGANRRFKFLWHYPSPAYASTVSYAVRAACKLERPGVTRRVAPCPSVREANRRVLFLTTRAANGSRYSGGVRTFLPLLCRRRTLVRPPQRASDPPAPPPHQL